MSEQDSAHTHVVPSPQGPLVSIGVPVRNGSAFLEEALRLLVKQTHTNLEIIVSDNDSSDGSGDIIERFANGDSRIKVYKQSRPLTAIENFRFVFERASGEFFMWAACDDRRSLDYVERLLSTLQEHPNASLAFGDLVFFSESMHWEEGELIPHAFETTIGDSWYSRLLRITRSKGHHVYGLIRKAALKDFEWLDIVDRDNDVPLNVHLILWGDLVRSFKVRFYYYSPALKKTVEKSALDNNLGLPKPFPEVRMAWACARSLNKVTAIKGNAVPCIVGFAIVYANRHWRWIKPWLFELAPKPVVSAYRKWVKHVFS